MKARITQARYYASDIVKRAREFIYQKGYFITSAGMERMLKPLSLVPTLVSPSLLFTVCHKPR